jgi:hypothetical protein
MHEASEFFDKDSLIVCYETAAKVFTSDYKILKVNPYSEVGHAIFNDRLEDVLNRALKQGRELNEFEGDNLHDLIEIKELDAEGLARKPMPKRFRKQDTNSMTPLWRHYIDHHMDLMDAGFHSARDERMFYKAVRREANVGNPIGFLVRMYEHAKDYWGIE